MAETMAAHEVVSQFLDAMGAAGIQPAEPIADILLAGERARFQCVGDRKGRKNGWARLYLDDHPAGAFGSYKGDFRSTWMAGRTASTFSKEERAANRAKIQAQQEARTAEQAAKHAAVAVEAQALIDRAAHAKAHPYLARKRIEGDGMFVADGELLVPMQDEADRIWNVQRIYRDGSKRFLPGARIKGLFWMIGDKLGRLCIGEGVGTMAAVRRATGYAVVAAISESNLEPVARLLRQRWPDRPMTICADDDTHLVHHPRIRRNLGLDAARAAAAAIGATVALPPRSARND